MTEPFTPGGSKPHQGLSGATPAEVYFGFTPACLDAKRPLRQFELKTAKRLESDKQLFEIAYLDPEHLLPVLVPLKVPLKKAA